MGQDVSSLLVNAGICATVLYLLSHFLEPRKTSAPLPPGPAPKLLIGNLGDLPPKGAQEWLFWAKHKELYGPLSYLNVLGQKIMIINDHRVALDLLEKRSGTYSDRPVLPFAGEL